MTNEFKQQIVDTIRERRANYVSDSKMANALGVSPSQFSRVMKGELGFVLAEAKWISIARQLDVNIGTAVELKIANTPVFQYITEQLKNCQDSSLSGLLCDIADIGKTFAAKQYIKTSKNAVYIDCSQCKSKQKLIRSISKELGIGVTGRYSDIYDNLVYYLKSIENPLIIIDEAGDLDYSAFLELKALWNATEYACGWYMMGADGLKAKIESNLNHKKVGYQEMFSRYGNRYQKISPDGVAAMDEFKKVQTAMIAKVNGVTEVQKLYTKTGGSLRRIRIEIQKLSA